MDYFLQQRNNPINETPIGTDPEAVHFAFCNDTITLLLLYQNSPWKPQIMIHYNEAPKTEVVTYLKDTYKPN